MKADLNISSILATGGEDARADRATFFWIALFLVAFLTVDVLSSVTEQARSGGQSQAGKILVYESTSIAVMLTLLPAIAWATSRATPGQHDWRRVIVFHIAFSLVFSIIHVIAMVLARKALFPLFFDAQYIFTSNLLRDFIYEYRKDALSYALIVFFITFGRQLVQQRRELEAARQDAKETKRITLKCGGRTIMVDADEIRWVKSASNYVEVASNGKTHLARSTLAAIENQLTEAGANAVRVHRSHIVNLDHVSEIKPTGEGDVKIEMNDGSVIPGSRRYRDRLSPS